LDEWYDPSVSKGYRIAAMGLQWNPKHRAKALWANQMTIIDTEVWFCMYAKHLYVSPSVMLMARYGITRYHESSSADQ
jgi:hypothetical protein